MKCFTVLHGQTIPYIFCNPRPFPHIDLGGFNRPVFIPVDWQGASEIVERRPCWHRLEYVQRNSGICDICGTLCEKQGEEFFHPDEGFDLLGPMIIRQASLLYVSNIESGELPRPLIVQARPQDASMASEPALVLWQLKANESLQFNGHKIVQAVEDHRVFGEGEIVGAALVNLLAGTFFSATKDGQVSDLFWDGKTLSLRVF